MESKFNRPFRSHDDDIKIRGYGSYTEDEIQVIKRDLAEYLAANYDEQRLGSLHLQSELGGDIDPKIDFILKELLSYFDNLGVGPVSCDEFFLVPRESLVGSLGVSSRVKGIRVSSPDLSNLELRQMVFLKTLAHELYHSTAVTSLTVSESTEGYTIHREVDIDGGASYGGKDDPLLLEEGLAASFEEYMTPKIKQLFSNDVVEEYDELVAMAVDLLAEPELTDRNDIRIYETEDGIAYSTSQYYQAKRLVQYLESEIEDFLFLVENARLKRHTLPLARAIETRFGKGSYRRITTALATEGDQVLSELAQ